MQVDIGEMENFPLKVIFKFKIHKSDNIDYKAKQFCEKYGLEKESYDILRDQI